MSNNIKYEAGDSKYSAGDSVRLKNHIQPMVIQQAHNHDMYDCVWQDSIGRPHMERYSGKVLERNVTVKGKRRPLNTTR